MSHAKQLHHRRYLNDYLEIINREGLPGNVKTNLCLTVQDTVIATVQHVIEAALEEELRAYLGLDRYEHLPWGRPPESTRSGSYQRALLTQYGPIADLHVPKLRRGNGAWSRTRWLRIMFRGFSRSVWEVSIIRSSALEACFQPLVPSS